MDTQHDYAYLWNGSEPGWVLFQFNRQVLSFTVRFPGPGPTLKDIAAIRSAVPSFGAMSAQQAFSELKGAADVTLGPFESHEGRRLAQECRERGLTIEVEEEDHTGYLFVNEITKVAMIIEDDFLAKRLGEEALARGVPVRRHIEE